jgi:UDP-N-acetyl-D-glucosamine dehydrogenase
MTVGIMGLGCVGLPLAVAFAEAGEHVVGVDIDPGKVGALRAGESYIEDVPSRCWRVICDRIDPTTRVAGLALCDAIVVCVPTPLTRNREPDLEALAAATRALAHVLQPDQLVVYESTSYPGAVRERALPILEESGLTAGEDFHLAYSPERVNPGRQDYTLRTTPKIIGGLTPACRERAEDLYGAVCEVVVPVSTLEVAEMAKLLEDSFRSVNAALVNELAALADQMAIDIWEVIEAAASKPFGFMRFDPGGSLPVNPFSVSWKAPTRGGVSPSSSTNLPARAGWTCTRPQNISPFRLQPLRPGSGLRAHHPDGGAQGLQPGLPGGARSENSEKDCRWSWRVNTQRPFADAWRRSA